MVLYHVEVGFPKWYQAPTGTVAPRYGDHSRFEAQTDRYGRIALPPTLDLSKFKAIEIGVVDGRVVKTLYRGQLDHYRDICIVLTESSYVKTVWVNLRSDGHRTLDRARYADPRG